MESTYPPESHAYSTVAEAQKVFESLLQDEKLPLSSDIRELLKSVEFHGEQEWPVIPTPFRETEAITALKGLEAAIAIALGKSRYGFDQTGSINADHATIFLFMSYLSTIDGYGKWDPQSVERLKPTDLFEAQSNLYRRLSANMYETAEPNVYYHTHGSLEATPIFEGIGLPGYQNELKDYKHICEVIQAKCKTFTAEELDRITEERRQAGAIVYTPEAFLETEQGKAIRDEPLFSLEVLEMSSPPAPWPSLPSSLDSTSLLNPTTPKPQILTGIKILDLSRVIAGPVISRTLAEYGAQVLKITSPKLPDVPYYQVDLNFGKRTADLDLKNSEDRSKFELLLEDVDVIIDGYRSGALERLGYGPKSLVKRFQQSGRKKGFVYVAENCFGFTGPWKERSGWQPVADAVSGLAWGHGRALGLNEPVLPPFPLSDYATGELGAIAALNALHQRATKGGSYFTGVSLTQYNLWVMSRQPYPDSMWQEMKAAHSETEEIRQLNHLSNFDVVSKAAISSMSRLHPAVFNDKFMFEMHAPGFGGTVKSCLPVVVLDKTLNQWNGTTRPNGFDQPCWT